MTDQSWIFIVKGDAPLILHPFSPGSGVFDPGSRGRILGRYGAGEAPSDSAAVRSELYRAMERGARKDRLEKGWYLRMALAAAAFLVVYLFFSIVVRDPLPMVDELLLGGFAAAAAWLLSERRALSSHDYLDQVAELRRSLDAAFFSESRVVDLLESWRDEALALGPAAHYRALTAEGVELGPDERDEAAELCSHLSRRWRTAPIVAELYGKTTRGLPVGRLLDKAEKRLGRAEAALAIAYIRLLSLLPEGSR